MAKNATIARINALSDELLRALDSQRQRGGEDYPPTLRRLAELCKGSPSIDDAAKAATKKPFTGKAVVLEKDNKLPKPDSPVYFKEDKPSPKELKEQAIAILTDR